MSLPWSTLWLVAALTAAGCRAGARVPVAVLDAGMLEERAHQRYVAARLHLAAGSPNLALADLHAATILDPGAATPRRDLGRLLLSYGHDQLAVLHLQAARREGDARGLVELAIAHRRLGNHAEAIEIWTELYRLKPRRQLPLVQLHALLLLAGRIEEGREMFTAVTSDLPGLPFGHEALGDFQLRIGSGTEALISYERAGRLGVMSRSLERKIALARRRMPDVPIAEPHAAESRPPRTPAADPGLGLPAKEVPARPVGGAVRGGGS